MLRAHAHVLRQTVFWLFIRAVDTTLFDDLFVGGIFVSAAYTWNISNLVLGTAGSANAQLMRRVSFWPFIRAIDATHFEDVVL